MAEDRELFRDLLDRIGQPYAPSAHRRRARPTRRAPAPSTPPSPPIGLPAIVRPAFTLGGTGGGIVETEEAYRERVRAGLRASPIGQVMVEQCLVGWQEIEYEVMRDADDTCIAVCSMENVDPLGVHTGDSIVVAPVQTLPDPVHQRLRTRGARDHPGASAWRAAATSSSPSRPTTRDYAVIEVNPRVSRSLGARVARRPAIRSPASRPRSPSGAGSRRSRTSSPGTTVAAFEPALDYVVVKLPRFPFDKFPRGRPDARQPDEGDRRGDGDRPDLRGGAEQGAPRPGAGGRGPAGRGRRLGADARLPRGSAGRRGGPSGGEPAATGRTPTRTTRHPLDRRGRRGLRVHPPRPAERARRSCCAGSSPRPTPALAHPRAAPPRRRREAAIVAATGITPWFLAELGRLDRAGARRVRGAGAAHRRPGRRRRRPPCSPRPSAAAFGDRELATLAGVGRARRRGGAGGARPRARATRWWTRARPSSPRRRRTSTRPTPPRARAPEAPPVPRPAALVIG